MTKTVKRKTRYRSSLLWKHVAVVVAALAIGFGAFFALSPLFDYVIEQEYMTDEKERERIEEVLVNFKSWVEQSDISTSNMDAILEWSRENENFKVIVLEGIESDTVPDTQKYDYSIEVEFSDKTVLVAVQDYAEVLYFLGDILAMAVAIVLFVLIVIVYYQAEISRIMRLSRDVKAIAGGDLQGKIGKMGNDEIAQLASHVDGMRDSILQKMEEKEQAWRANQELITSISHDIRTPLTSLLGYLELIDAHRENLSEEQQKYLSVCTENAGRIKRQSDELFNYFLAYGHKDDTVPLEQYNAAVLFDQLLSERFMSAEISNVPLQYELSSTLEGVRVYTNVDYLSRVLDNLYSNIVKYADHQSPAVFYVQYRDRMVVVTGENKIAKHSGKVESTKLGLLTCESIMHALQGSFRTQKKDDTFTVVLSLPTK
ncbi:MAG: HAMP domain-containing histidine kinase [Clostridia bacterium]|nr:HAMP domain-containing histidine kinase [Clostridia bacterium]